MIDIEDYKLIRDGIKAHIAYEYKDGQKVSYLWAFDMIFSFPYVSTLFIESQLKLRKYIQANKVSIENLKELRRRLDFYILDYSSFEEMIDVALEYSLCILLYDGVPRDLEDFRELLKAGKGDFDYNIVTHYGLNVEFVGLKLPSSFSFPLSGC
jgi:hypothetical protein